MIIPTPHYSEPIVCTASRKDWYVFFEYFHDGKWHKRKLREGINRIKDKKQRRSEADALAETRLQWLKEGWNPVTDPEFKLRKIQTAKEKAKMNFKAAMLHALSKKKVKPKSLTGYTTQVNFIIEAAEETGHNLLPISEVDRGMCWDILDKVKELRVKEFGKFQSLL